MEAAPSGADLLSPAEADWPPELRLPAPPPPPPAEPPPAQAPGMDDSQFLGSIMGDSVRQGPAEASAPVAPKRRGRPPKKRDGAALVAAPAKPAKKREDEEEVVCFICFDGGNLVVCDRRCLPYACCLPAFFSEAKLSCLWFRNSTVCFSSVCCCRGCPKVYHPACIKREESFFNSRTKWNCGELIILSPALLVSIQHCFAFKSQNSSNSSKKLSPS